MYKYTKMEYKFLCNYTNLECQKEVSAMYTEVFPSRLRKARQGYGYTQEQMAQLLNIKQGAYTRYETGLREPNYEILATIAVELNTSIDWLLGITIKDGTDHNKEIREERNRKEILKKMEREALLAQRLEQAN